MEDNFLKKQGKVLWGFANGIDLSPVIAEAPANKGYGNSTTIPFDVSDTDTAFRVLLALSETLAAPTSLTVEIYQAARELFMALWNGRPIRHLGIHTGKVGADDGMRQIHLFDEINYEKLSLLDKMVDGIRDRFGIDSVMRASFLDQPIDHMCGGVSREKRSVNYDKIAIQ